MCRANIERELWQTTTRFSEDAFTGFSSLLWPLAIEGRGTFHPLFPPLYRLFPYIHCWMPLRKWESLRHETTLGLCGHLAASQEKKNPTTENDASWRCTELQVSPSSSPPAGRPDSQARRGSSTQDTPRWTGMGTGPTPRDSDRGHPSWARSVGPRKWTWKMKTWMTSWTTMGSVPSPCRPSPKRHQEVPKPQISLGRQIPFPSVLLALVSSSVLQQLLMAHQGSNGSFSGSWSPDRVYSVYLTHLRSDCEWIVRIALYSIPR